MKKTNQLTTSGVVIALYVAVMYMTQSFAFGAYQIRIATSFYALAYSQPFLILPLGLANFLSNLLMGGMGAADVLGGTLVGIVTSGAIALISRYRLPDWLVVAVIVLGPGLLVPLWLSGILGLPYWALVLNLCVGQVVPAVAGLGLVRILKNMAWPERMWG